MAELEHVPAGEGAQIENIIRRTLEQLEKRYPGGRSPLRGQHAKGHACVAAAFKVRDDLPKELQIGVFAVPGRAYQAWIRFSNATATPGADSPVKDGMVTHGSRGMAIKLLGVTGTPLTPADHALTQDFLLVNHPAFPFANVDDYHLLTEVLAKTDDKPDGFFAARIGKTPNLADPATQRALKTLDMVKRIQSLSADAMPAAYQAPPASPVDNRYFGGAPFLFGDGAAMKISARPLSIVPGEVPDLLHDDYLRRALHQRLTAPGAQDVVFSIELQVQTAAELHGRIDTEIEDACTEWDEGPHPFVRVGTLTIPPQEFDTDERRAHCEGLSFSPWNGIAEHRPLGGINRLRRAVYEASSRYRHQAMPPQAPV